MKDILAILATLIFAPSVAMPALAQSNTVGICFWPSCAAGGGGGGGGSGNSPVSWVGTGASSTVLVDLTYTCRVQEHDTFTEFGDLDSEWLTGSTDKAEVCLIGASGTFILEATTDASNASHTVLDVRKVAWGIHANGAVTNGDQVGPILDWEVANALQDINISIGTTVALTSGDCVCPMLYHSNGNGLGTLSDGIHIVITRVE